MNEDFSRILIWISIISLIAGLKLGSMGEDTPVSRLGKLLSGIGMLAGGILWLKALNAPKKE